MFGKQYLSWIHEQDFLNIVLWVMHTPDINGVVHCSSPNPVTNEHFMRALRTSLRIPFGLPNIEPLIKLGCIFIGTQPELVLSGRRVISGILKDRNFLFTYPLLEDALSNLLAEQK